MRSLGRGVSGPMGLVSPMRLSLRESACVLRPHDITIEGPPKEPKFRGLSPNRTTLVQVSK